MISVVYCTRKPNREHYDHIRNTSGFRNKIEVIEIVNEGESLTKAYNRGLEQATNDIVVFCHDDILFNKNNWGRKLIKHFKNTDYGILGIAGTTDLSKTGKWWDDKSKMVGVVKHSHNGRTFESKYSGNFGSDIIETVVVDGLFFAIHKDRIKTKFDENVEGFHFYEIDFCFRNYLEGVKIGVVFDIKLTHKSIGQTNKEWEKNKEKFALNFADELPKKIKPNPNYEYEIKELKKEPKLKIFIESNGEKRLILDRLSEIEKSDYNNYEVVVVSHEDSVKNLEELENDKVKVFGGSFHKLHKNMSILRWDEDFINDKDELIMFLSDDLELKTNVINKFVNVYLKDNQFGCIFPRIINRDGTILSSGINITLLYNEKKETQVRLEMSGINSYYNYINNLTKLSTGNLDFCFMTTYKNLKNYDWFKLDIDEFLYASEYSTRCSMSGKNVYVDNNSVVMLSSVLSKDQDFIDLLNKDSQVLTKTLKENPKSINLLNKVFVPSDELRNKK